MRSAAVISLPQRAANKIPGLSRKVVVVSRKAHELTGLLEIPAGRHNIAIVSRNNVVPESFDDVGVRDVGFVDLSEVTPDDSILDDILKQIVKDQNARIHVILSNAPKASRDMARYVRNYYRVLSNTGRVWQGTSVLHREINRLLA